MCGGYTNEVVATRAGPVENERQKWKWKGYPQAKREMEGVVNPCSGQTGELLEVKADMGR